MTPRPAPPRAGAGFVLIGVLMFIMVLTILGLTLFSLSGIESQFFTRSQQQQQALQSAVGALYRTQFVLARTGRLSDARNLSGLAIPGVTYTTAWQDSTVGVDSLGSVAWNDTTKKITIRALAVINGERALVEARYLPKRNDDYYRRLLTLARSNAGGLVAKGQVISPPYFAASQVQLTGGAWVNRNDPALYAGIILPGPDFDHPIGGVPEPDVDSYLNTHLSAAVPMLPPADNHFVLTAPGGTGSVGLYKTLMVYGDDPQKFWSLECDPGYVNPGLPDNGQPPVIDVTGPCIWMFDQGFRALYEVTVNGKSSNSLLLIVTKSGRSTALTDQGQGIAFTGGLVSNNCPVVIVSEGGVGIEHIQTPGSESAASYLSIFADWAMFWGPQPGHSMAFGHPADSPPDLPGGLIDQLAQNGYLPNMTGGTGARFLPIAGTWHLITMSDGSN